MTRKKKKQNIGYIDGWKAENTERIVFYARKEEAFNDRISAAIDAGFAPSRQAYILAAVNDALARDGFPLCTLGSASEATVAEGE